MAPAGAPPPAVRVDVRRVAKGERWGRKAPEGVRTRFGASHCRTPQTRGVGRGGAGQGGAQGPRCMYNKGLHALALSLARDKVAVEALGEAVAVTLWRVGGAGGGGEGVVRGGMGKKGKHVP